MATQADARKTFEDEVFAAMVKAFGNGLTGWDIVPLMQVMVTNLMMNHKFEQLEKRIKRLEENQ